jgi:hypothetical protein
MSAIVVVSGAVIAFAAAIGYFTRAAYHDGFAAGFAAARARFEKIIKIAKAEKLFRGLLDETETETDADTRGAQW